jgi:hypothetical protein
MVRVRAGLIFFLVGSGDDTVFSKVQIVHCLIDNFLDFFPVTAPLYEFVNVLPACACVRVWVGVRRQSSCRGPPSNVIGSPRADMLLHNALRHGRSARGL